MKKALNLFAGLFCLTVGLYLFSHEFIPSFLVSWSVIYFLASRDD